MSFYREMEVDAEIATLNERLLIFQARGRPTTKLNEKNGFAWVTRALQQRPGTTELRRIQTLLSDARCLRGRDATSAIGRRIKNRMRCVQCNERSICDEHRISLCDDGLGAINLFILCYIILLYYIIILYCIIISLYYYVLYIILFVYVQFLCKSILFLRNKIHLLR